MEVERPVSECNINLKSSGRQPGFAYVIADSTKHLIQCDNYTIALLIVSFAQFQKGLTSWR